MPDLSFIKHFTVKSGIFATFYVKLQCGNLNLFNLTEKNVNGDLEAGALESVKT